jgi:hypothetical protein
LRHQHGRCPPPGHMRPVWWGRRGRARTCAQGLTCTGTHHLLLTAVRPLPVPRAPGGASKETDGGAPPLAAVLHLKRETSCANAVMQMRAGPSESELEKSPMPRGFHILSSTDILLGDRRRGHGEQNSVIRASLSSCDWAFVAHYRGIV